MSFSVKTLAPSDRMVWFDANRAMAAFGVVLIHCTTDFTGQPFSQASVDDRAGPIIIRALSELSGAEMFFLFSLFLIAFKLDRRRLDYGHTLREQAQRLLIPFAFWTVFYAFFRLLKASAFGYSGTILTELGTWQAWIGYFSLGSAEYHLHFLPTLFLLVFFYPCMRLAVRYPITGLLIVPLLGIMNYVQGYVWGAVADPGLRDYIVRAIKILGYVGYGYAAFAIYGFWKDGLPRGEAKLIGRAALFLVVFFVLAGAPYFGEAMVTGRWPVRESWSFFSHLLMPILIFLIFMGRQYANWSPRWSRLARYTFGIYLVHPVFVDLYDVLLSRTGMAINPTVMVLTKFAFVAPAALLTAIGISRLQPLAWIIGLGTFPSLKAYVLTKKEGAA